MKILFIVYTDLSLETGLKTHVKELAHNLETNGNRVTLICRKGCIKDLRVSKSFCYNYSNEDSFFAIFFYYLFSMLLLFFRICINTRDVDIIYFRNYKLGPFIAILKRIFRKKAIFEVNGLEYRELELRGTGLIVKTFSKIVKFAGMAAAKGSDKIIAVTEKLKDVFIKEYNIKEDKIVVINNGVNHKSFTPALDSGMIKKEQWIQNANYVCFVGALAPWQGLEYLIQAAPLILKEIPNTKVLIIGDGIMKKELMELAVKTGVSDNVIFTGAVPHEEVPKYINASDVCVATFIKERNMNIGLSPLKIFEYAACEKPIVSSRIPNLEFIEDQNAGILVEPENPEELAKATIKLLKGEKLGEEMGRNGREYVVKNHGWEAVARRVAEVCESVIEEQKKK